MFRDVADAAKSPVLKASNIKLPPGRFVLRPSKKDVGRRLHGALPLDNTPTLMPLIGRRANLLENRSAGFLDLQEKRLGVAASKQPDEAECPDGAHADRLESEIFQLIAVQKEDTVWRQPPPIGRKDRAGSMADGSRWKIVGFLSMIFSSPSCASRGKLSSFSNPSPRALAITRCRLR